MRTLILHCAHLKRDISVLQAVPNAEVLQGAPTPRGEDGCLEMHKQAVRMAMAAGDPAVWVMEDDCQFSPGFAHAHWLADAAWAQAQGYDVLVGGTTRTYGARRVRQGVIEVLAFHSAHCLVYFASGYAKVLQAVQPFDLSLGRKVSSNFATTYCGCRVAVVVPFVAVQRPVFSGILQKDVDYRPEYTQHERELAAIR